MFSTSKFCQIYVIELDITGTKYYFVYFVTLFYYSLKADFIFLCSFYENCKVLHLLNYNAIWRNISNDEKNVSRSHAYLHVCGNEETN